MADAGVIFDTPSAQRIVRVVKAVEGQGPNLGTTKTGGARRGTTFHARLTAEGTGDDAGKYKWKAVWRRADGEWVAVTPATTSDNEFTAQSYNGNEGLATGDTAGLVVELEFHGYDEDEKPVYLFKDGTAVAKQVKCVDDYDHGSNVVSVKDYAGGSAVGEPFDVMCTVHTSVDDTFWVVPRKPDTFTPDVAWIQIGMPKVRSQFMVLQIMDSYGFGQSIDWDFVKGHD